MICVENLTKYYDSFCAVDQISFKMKKGEIMGLLGPNGAGKTTTLKMLTGYFKPTDGSIAVGDYTIGDNPLKIKQMIGYLPETSPFYKDMLVYDYLEYVAKIRGIKPGDRHPRLRYLADLCGLNDIMHKAIGELSKGLNQRVGLAHAMMNDPEILILDEPTQGLDPNQIVEIRNIIKKIGKEKPLFFQPIFSVKPKQPVTELSSSTGARSLLMVTPTTSNNRLTKNQSFRFHCLTRILNR